jgi:nucleoside-diphosphate-sugar epimerase
MRIFIVGGGGFIGRHVAGRLRAAGHEVMAASRAELDLARDDEVALRDKIAGFEVVINCAGVARDEGASAMARVHGEGAERLIRACATAGVTRFVHVSALGVSNTGETRYQRTKAVADDFLESFDPTGARLDWRVLRPSLVLGRGGASFDLQLALAALPLTPRIGDGRWRLQPVHVNDLAEIVERLVEGRGGDARKIDVVGPAPMTTDELSRVLRSWLGLSAARFVAAPLWWMKLVARIAPRVSDLPFNAELLTMLARGNVGDAAAATAALGRAPHELAQALALHPAGKADRQAARLYFLRPLLRLSLALLWIASGVLSLWLYPREDSYALLASLGLHGAPASLALYTGGALDLVLGLLLLFKVRPVAVGIAQLVNMGAFTLLTLGLTANYWLHPFAPLLKNLPIAAALLVMIALEA